MPQPERMPVMKKAGPRQSGSRKLLSILLLLFCVLLIILFFRSSMSKVSAIRIEGNRYASAAQIGQALGLRTGDSFFYPSSSRLAVKVKQAVPQVEKVQVVKHFPGEIVVRVTEYPPAAYEQLPSGQIMLDLANGTEVAPAEGSNLVYDRPILSGWSGQTALKRQLCTVLAQIPSGQLSDISEILPAPSESYQDKIKLYTRSHFEGITRVSLLKDRIGLLNTLTSKEKPGVITMLEADTYVPFGAGDGTAQDSGAASAK